MPDVFVSYSAHDEQLAQFVRSHLLSQNLEVFIASISLNSGARWTPQVKTALRASDWVFLLASKAALQSPYVQMEMGGAVFGEKKLVPIMWDVEPSDLPRWVSDYQGLVLKNASSEDINVQMSHLAAVVKAEKVKGLMIAGALFAGTLYLLSR